MRRSIESGSHNENPSRRGTIKQNVLRVACVAGMGLGVSATAVGIHEIAKQHPKSFGQMTSGILAPTVFETECAIVLTLGSALSLNASVNKRPVSSTETNKPTQR